MSAYRLIYSKRFAIWVIMVSVIVALSSVLVVAVVKKRAVAERLAVRETRVELQRSSEVLKWLQHDDKRLAASSLDVDELGAAVVDAVSVLTQEVGVLDWRLERRDVIDPSANHAVRSDSGVARALTLKLIVDFNVRHVLVLLDMLETLANVVAHRPVEVSTCRIERVPSPDGNEYVRTSDGLLTSTSESRPVPARLLVGRCEVDWPWWEEA